MLCDPRMASNRLTSSSVPYEVGRANCYWIVVWFLTAAYDQIPLSLNMLSRSSARRRGWDETGGPPCHNVMGNRVFHSLLVVIRTCDFPGSAEEYIIGWVSLYSWNCWGDEGWIWCGRDSINSMICGRFNTLVILNIYQQTELPQKICTMLGIRKSATTNTQVNTRRSHVQRKRAFSKGGYRRVVNRLKGPGGSLTIRLATHPR